MLSINYMLLQQKRTSVSLSVLLSVLNADGLKAFADSLGRLINS